MNKYTFSPEYSRLTGKPTGGEIANLAGYHCDFCGEFIPLDDENLCASPAYIIEESGDIEQTWYEEAVPRHPEVDAHHLFIEHEEYRYCLNFDTGKSCSGEMIQKAVIDPPDVGVVFTLFGIMEYYRLQVVANLIDNGVSLMELGLVEK